MDRDMGDSPAASRDIDPAEVTDRDAVGCASSGEQVARRVHEAPSNAAILGHDAVQFPPTLQDFLDQTSSAKPRLLQLLWQLSDFIPGLPSRFWYGAALSEVRYARQLHPNLPTELDSANHVFVVTSPHHGWPVSWSHWSIYSQGRFYHLSADVRHLKPTEQSDLSGLGSPKKKVPVKLKVQDLSDPGGATPDFAEAVASEKPFIAFEVGRSRYQPSQIEELGEEIVCKLATYDLLEANCQIFTQAMLERIVMAKRDCSVFVGTTAQLVAWDLHGRLDADAARPNSRASGYLIRSPKLPASRSLSSTYPFYYFTAADMSKTRSIRILYEDGHLAPGARDPTGKHDALGYAWDGFKTDFGDLGRDLKRVVREFYEDVARGKWETAFRGREEYRQERRKRLEEEIQNGRKFTGMEMAILKFFSHPGVG